MNVHILLIIPVLLIGVSSLRGNGTTYPKEPQVVKERISIVVLVTSIVLLAGCSAFEDHPCDGEWDFDAEDDVGNRGSVRITVYESEIYSFHGNYSDPEKEEEKVIF